MSKLCHDSVAKYILRAFQEIADGTPLAIIISWGIYSEIIKKYKLWKFIHLYQSYVKIFIKRNPKKIRLKKNSRINKVIYLLDKYTNWFKYVFSCANYCE